jgi:hypothetical protein
MKYDKIKTWGIKWDFYAHIVEKSSISFFMSILVLYVSFFLRKKKPKLNFVKSNVNLMLEHIITY